MKKNLLFILMAVLLSLPMQAKTAPAQIELSENQRIMGHFDSDAITTEGAKVKTTGKVSIGTILNPRNWTFSSVAKSRLSGWDSPRVRL